MASKNGLRMPQKMAVLHFDEDGYPGFECDGWINAPMRWERKLDEITADTPQDDARKLLLQFFPRWNFRDTEGKAIPHAIDGFDDIPGDLLRAMGRRRIKALVESAMPAPLDESSSPDLSELQGASKALTA